LSIDIRLFESIFKKHSFIDSTPHNILQPFTPMQL